MPKEEIQFTAAQWEQCKQAVGRYGVPQDQSNQYRQGKLFAWLQFTKDEEESIREGGGETIVARRMAGGMKRRLVAIMTDFAFQGWRQAPFTLVIEPILLILGWAPEYDDEDEDDDTE